MTTEGSAGRAILLVAAALVLLAVLVPLFVMILVMPMMGAGMGFWNGTMGTTWPWLLAWLVHLALFLGVGYVLYRALRGSTGRQRDPALEELRVAYARSDLSSEEFEERRRRLERGERGR